MAATSFFPAWRHQLGPMRTAKTLTRKLRCATLAQIEARLAPALPKELLDKPKSHHHSRDRIFPLYRTFWCWIWQVLQANTSCREVVRQVQALFAWESAGSVDEASGAYCEARRKLPQTVLEKAFTAAGKNAEEKAHLPTALKGRPLKVLDGSTVRLADTPANRKAYPPPDSVPTGCGFPLLKIVVLFSLASGALLARATGNQYTHEVRICAALRACFVKGDIIVADRAYAIFSVLVWLQSLGLDMIGRVPTRLRRIDFRRAKKRFRNGDGLFIWQKPARACAFLPLAEWLGLPREMTVRILRAWIKKRGLRTKKVMMLSTLIDAYQ